MLLMLLTSWADSYPGNSHADDPTSARVKILETRQLQFYWCGWKFPKRWFLWDRCSNCCLTPNEASSQPSRKVYGASLKRTIPQPPLPCKNNGLSHDQHTVRQQGGSGGCGEIVVNRELLALAIFSLLPYLRYVILLQLKYCKTKFIVKLLDREIHSYSAIG